MHPSPGTAPVAAVTQWDRHHFVLVSIVPSSCFSNLRCPQPKKCLKMFPAYNCRSLNTFVRQAGKKWSQVQMRKLSTTLGLGTLVLGPRYLLRRDGTGTWRSESWPALGSLHQTPASRQVWGKPYTWTVSHLHLAQLCHSGSFGLQPLSTHRA